MDLNNNTCGCRSWQVSGIPCVHAVAAISYLNGNAEDYVAPWFHTTMFLTCYNHTINPLNGSSMWPEVTYMKPLPPQKIRLLGRPTIKWKRDQSERESQGKTRYTISKAGAVIRCTICRETGHNRSTCPTRPKDVASTSLPKKKKDNKCKTEKGMLLKQCNYTTTSNSLTTPLYSRYCGTSSSRSNSTGSSCTTR